MQVSSSLCDDTNDLHALGTVTRERTVCRIRATRYVSAFKRCNIRNNTKQGEITMIHVLEHNDTLT